MSYEEFTDAKDKTIEKSVWNGPLQIDGFSRGAEWAYSYIKDCRVVEFFRMKAALKASKVEVAELRVQYDELLEKCAELKAREVNNTLRGYDGSVDAFEAERVKVYKLTKALEKYKMICLYDVEGREYMHAKHVLKEVGEE